MWNPDSTARHGAARALATALVAACAMPAFAQGEAQAQATPSRALAEFMQEAKARQAAAAAQGGPLDHTPPVLHKVDVSGGVNAQVVDQYVTATVKVTDDLSGVASFLVEFRSPTGTHHVTRLKTTPTPLPSLTARVTVGAAPYSDPPFMRFAEPGTWIVDDLKAMDAAGNIAEYNESELRFVSGHHTFFVSNSGGYDIVPPQLASGVILTPNVRLSKAPPGLPQGTPPYVGAEVSITDSGNGVVSGSHEGNLKFCLPGCADSFVMNGLTNRTGTFANTLGVGTQLRQGQTPGNYVIYSLELVDSAGSHRLLISSDFGGGTNFHNYFPQGVAVFLNQ
jgi:hypothetical protein